MVNYFSNWYHNYSKYAANPTKAKFICSHILGITVPYDGACCWYVIRLFDLFEYITNGQLVEYLKGEDDLTMILFLNLPLFRDNISYQDYYSNCSWKTQISLDFLNLYSFNHSVSLSPWLEFIEELKSFYLEP